MSYATALKNKTRELAHTVRQALPGQRGERLRLRPWAPVGPEDLPASGAWCVLCGWRGEQFPGPPHSEAAQCPRCQTVGRDRFIYLCLYQRVPYGRRLRLLETSPRLGGDYRRVMQQRVRYLASDYDERAHKASDTSWEPALRFPEFDYEALVTAAAAEDLVVVADDVLAERDGIYPSYQFLTWEAV